jgi:hypothetical protein
MKNVSIEGWTHPKFKISAIYEINLLWWAGSCLGRKFVGIFQRNVPSNSWTQPGLQNLDTILMK